MRRFCLTSGSAFGKMCGMDKTLAERETTLVKIGPGDVLLFRPMNTVFSYPGCESYWILVGFTEKRLPSPGLYFNVLGTFGSREEGELFASSAGLRFRTESDVRIWATLACIEGGYRK